MAVGKPIVKRAGVCITHIGWCTGGGSTNVVSCKGQMSSSSSIMRSHAVGSTFGGIGQPLSCAVKLTALLSLKLKRY